MCCSKSVETVSMTRNVGFLHAVPQTVTDNTYTWSWWEITTCLQARTGGFHWLDEAPTSTFTCVISLAGEVTAERPVNISYWHSAQGPESQKGIIMGFYRTHWLSLSHHLTDQRQILTLLLQYSSQRMANPASLVAMPTLVVSRDLVGDVFGFLFLCVWTLYTCTTTS